MDVITNALILALGSLPTVMVSITVNLLSFCMTSGDGYTKVYETESVTCLLYNKILVSDNSFVGCFCEMSTDYT